jgi:hypothetical protein
LEDKTMETNVVSTATSGDFTPALIGDRVIRRDFYPPYCNPPISNYRKLWTTANAAFWSAFRVTPGDGGTINQLGTNPTTCAVRGFQEVGFGYTFKAAATADYWFDVAIDAGPISADCAKNSIELQLLGSNVAPVVIPLNCRYLKTNATLYAGLTCGVQYTLLFKSKVEIAVSAGGRGYGEVIAKFPKLTVSYLLEGTGPEPPSRFAAETETLDLGAARSALVAADKGGEIVFEQVSYKEIAQAGAAGFGTFQDGN